MKVIANTDPGQSLAWPRSTRWGRRRFYDPWAHAVVPLLRAAGAGTAARQVLNAPDATGLTREAWFDLHQGRPSALPAAAHPPTLHRWLDAFETHEAVCLDALGDPTLRNLKRVREADPLMGVVTSKRPPPSLTDTDGP